MEMAEFHLVGEIVGGTGFKHKNIFCKVRSVINSGWCAVPRVNQVP